MEKSRKITLKCETMITKEQFLYDTREEEVFGLLHEFVFRLNKIYQENNQTEHIIPDELIGIISEQMINNIKNQLWIK